MVVPLPISDSVTAILPWWYSSTIRRESDNPRPQPRVLVVKPGSKMRFQLLLGIPLPVSLTSIITCCSSDEMRTSIAPWPCRASSEFFIRFSTTHSNSAALMFACTGAMASPL